METKGLNEIDKVALERINKDLSPEQRTTLDITRTGASWNRTAAFWAGQAEDKMCQLCNEAEEKSDHSWYCKPLQEKRIETDAQLAQTKPG